jgi:hypothetical protein
MLTPRELAERTGLEREDLPANVYYLRDRGLVELMTGYSTALFATARITADGIDLVENHYQFNLLFPPAPGEGEEAVADVPVLMEHLVLEADFSALDGERRACLLRDVQYLREELARPVTRWRDHVIETVLTWVKQPFDDAYEALPSLGKLEEALARPRE